MSKLPSVRTPRQYEPVWEKLKALGTATLRVSPAFSATVKKAVQKEKHQDLAWKATSDSDYFWLDISYDAVKEIMVFTLKRRIGEL